MHPRRRQLPGRGHRGAEEGRGGGWQIFQGAGLRRDAKAGGAHQGDAAGRGGRPQGVDRQRRGLHRLLSAQAAQVRPGGSGPRHLGLGAGHPGRHEGPRLGRGSEMMNRIN